MMVDQNPISQAVPIAYDTLNMNHMNSIVNISPINPIQLSSYDIQHISPAQNSANVSMSIPVNNMSVNVNMNVNSINLSAMPGMPVNTINALPISLGLQPMNIGMIDGQRNYTNMNSGMDIPITRTTTVLFDGLID